jgi:lipopolysaccharide transport protein LptA
MKKVGWLARKDLYCKRWPVVVALLFMGWVALSSVPSESFDAVPEKNAGRGGPIRVTSDTVESDHRMGWMEFKGNVKATQEDVIITADRIKIFYELDSDASGERPRVAKIVSQGNVKILFDNKKKTAVAKQAVYHGDDKKLVLSGGGPTVRSGENVIRGRKITLFQGEDRTLVEGDRKSQVEAIIHTEVDEGLAD